MLFAAALLNIRTPSKLRTSRFFSTTLLDSWKAIAAYLKRDESTVRRWKKEGLPVHRHLHAKKASVYAYVSEIDLWWNKDGNELEPPQPAARGWRERLAWSLAILVAVAAGWITAVFLG